MKLFSVKLLRRGSSLQLIQVTVLLSQKATRSTRKQFDIRNTCIGVSQPYHSHYPAFMLCRHT